MVGTSADRLLVMLLVREDMQEMEMEEDGMWAACGSFAGGEA